MIGRAFPSVLASARAGNEAAFAQLWRDANPVLLRYLRVLAPGSAEDVAAETWLTVVRGLPGFKGDEQAWRGWLMTVARRRAIDAGRQRQRRPEVASETEPPPAPDTVELVLERLDTAAALALVATLPPMQAEVVLLRVVAGLDVKQVAAIVGTTPGAVRVAAHRGLQRLRELLGGVTP
jgi:RNA polymerase sigma-70 factor (ECF subfamily)